MALDGVYSFTPTDVTSVPSTTYLVAAAQTEEDGVFDVPVFHYFLAGAGMMCVSFHTQARAFAKLPDKKVQAVCSKENHMVRPSSVCVVCLFVVGCLSVRYFFSTKMLRGVILQACVAKKIRCVRRPCVWDACLFLVVILVVGFRNELVEGCNVLLPNSLTPLCVLVLLNDQNQNRRMMWTRPTAQSPARGRW